MNLLIRKARKHDKAAYLQWSKGLEQKLQVMGEKC